MGGSRSVRRRAAAIAVAVAALLVAVPPGAAHAEEGLDQAAVTTFTVDLAAGIVRGRVELTVENETPDSGGYFYYWDVAVVFAPVDATNVVAVDGDGDVLPVEIIPQGEAYPNYADIVISLDNDLNYGEQETIVVTYDLPGSAPRSEAVGRTNPAFAGFLAVANGDPGQSSVQVIAPLEDGVWDDIVADGAITAVRDVYGDQGVLTWNDIPDPYGFYAYVTAYREDALTTTVVTAGDEEVVVAGWPDDPEWQAYMTEQIPVSLVGLEDAIGAPFDANVDLVVRESMAPGIEGYGGWYDPRTGIIDVVEDIDPVLATHEISHVWFDDEFAVDRWVIEGFAETYARLVVEASGGTPGPDEQAAAGFDLNGWHLLETDEQVEADGYATSAYVVDALLDEIGEERMRDVVTALLERRSVYEAPTGSRPPSWQQLLDTLEDVGGSTQATSLFAEHVVTDLQTSWTGVRPPASVTPSWSSAAVTGACPRSCA